MLIKVKLCGSAWHGSQRCVKNHKIMRISLKINEWVLFKLGSGNPQQVKNDTLYAVAMANIFATGSII